MGRPMSVSVIDESGRLIYFSRADGASFLPLILHVPRPWRRHSNAQL
ncbi:MAG TPA: hypothetical protein EYQ42_12170 [Thiotrichaceae bacterium]|nr:hypothetical protein [Thiotrichaceae bacterium]